MLIGLVTQRCELTNFGPASLRSEAGDEAELLADQIGDAATFERIVVRGWQSGSGCQGCTLSVGRDCDRPFHCQAGVVVQHQECPAVNRQRIHPLAELQFHHRVRGTPVAPFNTSGAALNTKIVSYDR